MARQVLYLSEIGARWMISREVGRIVLMMSRLDWLVWAISDWCGCGCFGEKKFCCLALVFCFVFEGKKEMKALGSLLNKGDYSLNIGISEMYLLN